MDDEEAERVQAAVEVVAEMQLTAEQLKVRQQDRLQNLVGCLGESARCFCTAYTPAAGL
jgi:hypothetical protein